MIVFKTENDTNDKFRDLSNWNGKSRPADKLSRPADTIQKLYNRTTVNVRKPNVRFSDSAENRTIDRSVWLFEQL